MSDVVEQLVFSALEHEYPDRWEQSMPGFAATVHEPGKGMYIGYSGETVDVACGVASDLPATRDTVLAVAGLQNQLVLGFLHFGQPQDDTLLLLLTMRMNKRWLEAADFSAKQMLLDTVSNLPGMSRACADVLIPALGGQPWVDPPGPGWELVVMGHL